MTSARKNISSLWKERNGRRSVNPWRRQKRKERSWQNTARERRFSFSRRRKETEPESPDKKIYKMLEEIDFSFGGRIYKVADAGPMFAYEVDVLHNRICVVALTENFGTIIFDIPEGIAEKIKERVQQFPYSINDYLSFLIEFKDFEPVACFFRKCGVSLNQAAEALKRLQYDTESARMSIQDVSAAFEKAIAAISEGNQEPAPVPNNWLKMHGLPMRRKGRGRRKSE